MAPAAGPVVVGELRRVPVRTPRADRAFYSGMSLALLLLVVAGFGPTYYFRGLTGAPGLPPLVYMHGLIMTAWVLLFVAQTWLVASGRRATHRHIGIVGLALAAAMIVVGYPTAIAAARRGFNPLDTGVNALGFLLVPLGDLAIFALFVVLAVLLRRRIEVHKRLMLLGTIGALMPPALTRLPGPQPVTGVLLLVVLLAAGPVFDRMTRGRIHPVYKWATIPLLLSVPIRRALGATDTWQDLARWLVR